MMPQMSVCRLLAASGRMATLASRGAAPLRPLATSAPALADAPTHTGQQWEENVSALESDRLETETVQ